MIRLQKIICVNIFDIRLFNETENVSVAAVDLWVEYAQYSIGLGDLEVTRSILDRGLNAAGLVCDKGSLLWDTLREMENVYIGMYSKGSEQWKKQVLL